MRIAHITNFWPNHLGHAHYTDNLIGGIAAHRPGQQVVLGEGNTAAADNERFQAIPCWSRRDDYVDKIVAAARAAKVDLAYLQYSNDLFGADNRFPRLCAGLAAAGVRPIVTTHSVYPERWRSAYTPGRTIAAFDRACAEHVACFQVHSARMREDLIARGIDPGKIAIIAHGSKPVERRDPIESKRKLGIPTDARVVMFFGFIWLGKGVDGLLSSFARLQRELPDAFLYIGGYTRLKVFYTRFYMGYLRTRIKLLGLRARLWGDYVPEEEVPTMYSAADVVAMPYRQDYSSVSGVVHQTAGIGKLMLCSRISKFDEVAESISTDLLVDPYDRRAWAAGLARLLTDQAHAEQMRARILKFGEETSWPRVGALHVAMHDRLRAGLSASDGAPPPYTPGQPRPEAA
ncbi:MAG TPA: glycosyltransferase [Kofleriaceae bacterium]|nr:glycosyltransferase [Kofleriaceae bacterium]